ncbi:MAG: hypothetical protein JXL67_06160 [Calditrichaeota bacterium]|nr:hypothetical protein [Calditrichota bacterium]
MLSGEQVRKVILLKKGETYGRHNEEKVTWSADTTKFPDGEFYVEWWDQGGTETLEGGQIIAVKDIRAKCRFISGLNEGEYKIRKDSQDYDIKSIKELGRRKAQILILKIADNA